MFRLWFWKFEMGWGPVQPEDLTAWHRFEGSRSTTQYDHEGKKKMHWRLWRLWRLNPPCSTTSCSHLHDQWLSMNYMNCLWLDFATYAILGSQLICCFKKFCVCESVLSFQTGRAFSDQNGSIAPISFQASLCLDFCHVQKLQAWKNLGFVIETSWTLLETCCIAVWRWRGTWNSFSAMLVMAEMMQFHLHFLWLTGQLAVLNLAKACAGLLFVYARHTVSVSRKR